MAKSLQKRRGLKAALLSHQSLVSRQQRSKAAAAAEEKKAHKIKASKTAAQTDSRNHGRVLVSDKDLILLIGEGNFSFAVSLMKHHNIIGNHLVATAYDTEDDLHRKYPEASSNITALREMGATVLLGVDAQSLNKNKHLRTVCAGIGGFTSVVWNFPHSGAGIQDQDRNIKQNQMLLLAFLKSVPPLLAKASSSADLEAALTLTKDGDSDGDEEGLSKRARPCAAKASGGRVIITLRDVVPYTLWEVPRLANKPPSGHPTYVQLRSYPFYPSTYPGYEHRRTAGRSSLHPVDILKVGDGEGKQGPPCRTWEFVLEA